MNLKWSRHYRVVSSKANANCRKKNKVVHWGSCLKVSNIWEIGRNTPTFFCNLNFRIAIIWCRGHLLLPLQPLACYPSVAAVSLLATGGLDWRQSCLIRKALVPLKAAYLCSYSHSINDSCWIVYRPRYWTADHLQKLSSLWRTSYQAVRRRFGKGHLWWEACPGQFDTFHLVISARCLRSCCWVVLGPPGHFLATR